jgi:hypothetical protein
VKGVLHRPLRLMFLHCFAQSLSILATIAGADTEVNALLSDRNAAFTVLAPTDDAFE